MSNEFKVGLIVILGAAVLLASLMQLGFGIRKAEGLRYDIVFDQVGGLVPNAEVRFAGFKIGRVERVEIVEMPDLSQKIRVTIFVSEPAAGINANTVFAVGQNFMGDKWIEIFPKKGPPLKPNQMIIGVSPGSIERLLTEGQQTMSDLQESIKGFNKLINDPKLQSDIKESLANVNEMTANLKKASATADSALKKITKEFDQITGNVNGLVNNANYQLLSLSANLREFTMSLRRMADSNEGDVRDIVMNLKKTSATLQNTLEVINNLVAKKEFSASILETLDNVKRTSEEIQGIASDLHQISSDPQVKEDIKATLHDARETAEGAKKLIKKVNSFFGGEGERSGLSFKQFISIEAGTEYRNDTKQVGMNLNATFLPNGKTSLKLGIDDMGHDNLLNLQYIKGGGKFRPHVGIIRSQVGLGVDGDVGKNMGFTLDAYDTRDPQVDFLGKMKFKNDFYIIGGMGAVYQAEDLRLDNKICAVKQMLDSFANQIERHAAIDRFVSEIQVLGSMRHPNIPRVTDHFLDQNSFFFVMEYIEGIDLSSYLRKEGSPGFPEKKVVEWAIQVADALEHIHSLTPPIVHRDIKPSNLFLRYADQRILLIDFGIARVTNPQDGFWIGTPGYAPPEQQMGRPEPRSDIYALAAAMHELISGKKPGSFEFPTFSELKIEVSEAFETFIEQGLSWDPLDRPVNARVARDYLLDILGYDPRDHAPSPEFDFNCAVQNVKEKYIDSILQELISRYGNECLTKFLPRHLEYLVFTLGSTTSFELIIKKDEPEKSLVFYQKQGLLDKKEIGRINPLDEKDIKRIRDITDRFASNYEMSKSSGWQILS